MSQDTERFERIRREFMEEVSKMNQKIEGKTVEVSSRTMVKLSIPQFVTVCALIGGAVVAYNDLKNSLERNSRFTWRLQDSTEFVEAVKAANPNSSINWPDPIRIYWKRRGDDAAKLVPKIEPKNATAGMP